MGYNKGDIITVQIFNITEIGAFVRLGRKNLWDDSFFGSSM